MLKSETRQFTLVVNARMYVLDAMKELRARKHTDSYRLGELGLVADSLSCIVKRIEIEEYPSQVALHEEASLKVRR